MQSHYSFLPSPVGFLLAVRGPIGLQRLEFEKEEPVIEPDWIENCSAFASVQKQLDEYFRGERRSFDIPLDLQGTAFQRRVWSALRTIPWGQTASYGQIAARIGNPGASRAVGQANNRNPVVIIVPCHRVIGSDGKLVGFGGGMSRKEFLLDLESFTESN